MLFRSAYNVPELDYPTLINPGKLSEVFEFLDGQPCGPACLKSGVGREKEFTFLFEQAVEGYLLSCLDCGHPAPESFPGISYSVDWPEVPPIEGLPHPPPPTTVITVESATP